MLDGQCCVPEGIEEEIGSLQNGIRSCSAQKNHAKFGCCTEQVLGLPQVNRRSGECVEGAALEI